MLSKVLKYENKAMSRIMLPLYAALLASTLVTGILLLISKVRLYNEDNFSYYLTQPDAVSRILEIMTTVFMISFFVLIAAVCVATFIVILLRFNKSCLGDEGYLTFTLPVSIDDQLWGRILASAIWSLLSLIVVFLSIILLIASAGLLPDFFEGFIDGLKELFATEGVVGFLVQFVCSMLVSLITAPIACFFCLTLGQLIMPKHRIAGAFIVYFGLSFIEQILVSFLGYFGLKGDYLIDFMLENDFMTIMRGTLWYELISLLITGTIFYLVTRHILKNRLNLE
ncbi:MAG: hypothetical protein IJ744_08275 [Lachnospiraceae bacterium]|nr:hypothetical protein [Lachnospiraceae bacterium]